MSRPLPLLLAAALASAAWPLAAQQFDNPVSLPVGLFGEYTTANLPQPPPPPEEQEPSEGGWIYFTFANVDADNRDMGVFTNDTFPLEVSLPVAELQPNRPYGLTIEAQYVSEFKVWFMPPRGYRLRVIDGPVGHLSETLSYLELEDPQDVTFTVVLERDHTRVRPPGTMTRPTMGNLLWSVSLGRLIGGTSAGFVTLARA